MRPQLRQPLQLWPEVPATGGERSGQHKLTAAAHGSRYGIEQLGVQLVGDRLPANSTAGRRWSDGRLAPEKTETSATFGSSTTRRNPTAVRCASTALLVAIAAVARPERLRSPRVTATRRCPGTWPTGRRNDK